MSAILSAAVILFASGSPPPQHRCAADAQKRGRTLMNLHFSDGQQAIDEPIINVDRTVKTLPPLKALAGTGKFDVLEVWAYVYKAEYRMRFIYAQIPGQCVLMGQEIIEASDPY